MKVNNKSLSAEQEAAYVQLTAAYESAKVARAADNTQENRQAVIDASAALSQFITQNCPPKTRGNACRAGQRQAAEREAQRQAALRRR